MKDLNENKVEHWLGVIIMGCFAWATYFHFQRFFIKFVEAFANLPLWWFLIVFPLFAMSVVWAINLEDSQMKELETNIRYNQKIMTDYERCLRLMHYDIKQVPSIQFRAYCADLLRLMQYKDVRIDQIGLSDERGISAITPSGNKSYIVCQHNRLDEVITEEMIQGLHEVMLTSDIKEGLFITTTSFTSAALDLAKDYQINCIDGEGLDELIILAIREAQDPLIRQMLS